MNLKHLAFFWIMMCFFLPDILSQESTTINNITVAIQVADASKLAENFHTTIDLQIPGNEGNYSNKQAEQILKVFFKSNPVEKFTITHQGKSNDGSTYVIGTYKTTSAASFMVYVLLKKTGAAEQLHELRFEKE